MNAYAGVPADEVVNNNYLKNLFLGKNIYFWEKIFIFGKKYLNIFVWGK